MQETKKSPNLDLRGKIGTYVIGVFQARFENKTFPGKYSSLITVEETNGSTSMYDNELKKAIEVDIEAGDNVFLSESTWLATFLSKRTKGEKIKITYTGKGTAKKGQKAPFTYESIVIGE